MPHSTSEFDVTDKLRSGENEIRVLVVKWSSGTYAEDQDKLRMSGIFRDVYLLRRPQGHIRDFTVQTRLAPGGGAAIDVEVLGGKDVRYELQYGGAAVAAGVAVEGQDPHPADEPAPLERGNAEPLRAHAPLRGGRTSRPRSACAR